MAIVQLQSTNPDFSYVIEKNPATGMIVKSVRKGKSFGWFSDEGTYNVFFKDSENEISYPESRDQKFEYLNQTRYNSPLFPLNSVADFFNSASKKKHEKDEEGYEHTFFVNTVRAKHVRYLEYFQIHLPEFELMFEEVAHKTYSVRIRTNLGVYELLNFVNVLFLNLGFISEEYIDMNDETIEKFTKSIQAINAPFYIRYLFVRNLLVSKQKFRKYKGELEMCNHYPITFAFGGTSTQRRDFITNELHFDKPILDIGCGSGFYALPFSKKIADKNYYAIDIDPEILEKLKWRLEQKKNENVILYESLDHFLETYENDEEVDVVLTEVIEHIPIRKAKAFMKQILSSVSFDRFVITTPNSEFNKFYELEGMRHDDHKWEMSKSEFQEWMSSIVANTPFEFEWKGVGDMVDGIHTSQAVIITRKGDNGQ